MRSSKLFLSTLIPVLLCTACNRPEQEQAASNNIRSYLIASAAEITDNALSGITSLQDWEGQRDQRHEQFIEMMGLQDLPLQGERPALNVRYTGTIQQEGFRIEKLYYESLPGLYVPANLYIPDHITEPAPAILYLCEHTSSQKVYLQPHPRKFAELGFVCLITETIQYGEVRGEHAGCYSRGWFHWYSRGYTPGGVELWNSIRGLDLLSERPEVDPERLGVTGISGGGSQSWYVAAADPRVRAAAPVCGASTLKAQVTTRTMDRHCDCMMPVNTYRQGFKDIGALIAPRPLLIAQADGDGLNTIESVRELYRDISKMYSLHGSPENIGMTEYTGRHSYQRKGRQAINAFFLEHLMGKTVSPEEAGDVDTVEAHMLSAEELRVYIDGPPAGDRTTTIQDSFIKLHEDPEITSPEELHAFRDSVKQFLAKRTFGAFPEEGVPFDPEHTFHSLDGGRYGWDIYSFISEEGWRLKVSIRWKHDPLEPKPLMIVLRNRDEERFGAEDFSKGLGEEWNIAFLEVRGVGETGWEPGLNWHVRRASAWTGRTIASMQVYDLLRTLEFCRTLDGVNPEEIGIAGRDEMTVVAMYAALMDGNCHTLFLKDPPASQNLPGRPDGKGAAIEMLNCLRITDLYQLPALLAPASIRYLGVVPESYQWSEELKQ
ncbi:MAG: hypothetical protein ABFS28_10490 [Bacteroidota bacterium]